MFRKHFIVFPILAVIFDREYGGCGIVEKPEKGNSERELKIFSGTILNEQNGCKFGWLSGTRVSNLQWREF
jgi:hypothetical protein